jgi:hypothetical protein
MPLAGRLVLVLRLRRAVVALVLLLVAAAHTSVAHAYDLPDLYGGKGSTCFWNVGVVNGDTINIAYPDADANYWAAGYTIPAGASLQLRGQYPHARFASIQSYNLLGAGVDALVDYEINPDAGSENPFRPGVRRDVRRRSFTVTLLDSPPVTPLDPDQRSGQPARNVLATKPQGDTTGLHLLLWRVYVPDRGRGLGGGVPLPEPVLTLADGTVQTGQQLCDTLTSQVRRLPDLSSLLISRDQYDAMRYRPGVPPYFPAARRPVWRVQYNRAYLLALWTGETIADPPKAGQTGFFPNIANQYARAAINRKLGKVVALRGRMPTTPRTAHGEALARSTQMRYVSFCMNESVLTTRVTDCAYDEQIPLRGRDRRYVVVTSRRADRPRNARARCGVAWVQWSPRGDGGRDHDFGWMQIRNMLPAPGFHHAIQDTRSPGDERRVLGSYLPTATYYHDKRAFERLGCPVR